jgi:hypothetical protein
VSKKRGQRPHEKRTKIPTKRGQETPIIKKRAKTQIIFSKRRKKKD